jgi:hypothetical protein
LLRRLPELSGQPIDLRFLPELSVSRGQLRSGVSGGEAVHAASFIRKREMVLEKELLSNAHELARVFVHELFHFAWARLGNPARRSFESLIEVEIAMGARGELGWSSEMRKAAGVKSREYLCESFCDTAAWLYAGVAKHDEFTLAQRHRVKRARWFRHYYSDRPVSI